MDTELVTTPTDTGEIKRKTHFTGTVTKITLAGAVVDIGLEVPGVVHISQLQKDPVNRVEDVVQVGQAVEVWVRRTGAKDRVDLTMIKPLDYDWRDLKKDQVMKGKVVRLEKFGVFVDIGAERPGLVHISELTHDYIRTVGEVVKEGDEIDVKVLDVDRKKKQIKLSIKALEEPPAKVAKAVQKESRSDEGAREEPELPAPTAMEMALREAMERVKGTDEEPKAKSKKKSTGTRNELETMLSRTLQHRARTASK